MHQQDFLLRKILYRSIHRGCKETDFLIGEFAKAKLSEVKDLQLFSCFLQEDDMQIYDWVLKKEQAPEVYRELLMAIQNFHKI